MARADPTERLPVSVVIPTYRREAVLLDTVRFLMAQEPRAAEILVVDQTETHETQTEEALSALAAAGEILWIRLELPSIPAAMNCGLLRAREAIVLFLDDDIRPDPGLVLAHLNAHESAEGLIAGRVVQPWDEAGAAPQAGPSAFSGDTEAWVEHFIGANFSVQREHALSLGGFDENFVRVAYRYEAEFAHRFRESGRRIRFVPSASVHHLRAGAGGTRTFRAHLTTLGPDHAVGAYYCALRTCAAGRRVSAFLKRLASSIATRHHARRPWGIPGTLIAEIRGMAWALKLNRRGPRYARIGRPDA